MNDKYEAKIAALLRKAETTTPEEAEALTQRAAEMMIKYGIEQAAIDARRIGQDAREEIVQRNIFFDGVYAGGMVVMGHLVAQALGLETLRSANVHQKDQSTGKTRKGEMLWLIGFKSDVEQAMTLIASLQLQCVVALDAWWKGEMSDPYNKTASAMNKFKMRRAFIMSFGSGAGHRIKQMRVRVEEEADNTTPGTALVLVDRRKQVRNYVDEHFGNRRQSRGLSSDARGSGAGYAAGRNANVGGSALNGGRKAVGR